MFAGLQSEMTGKHASVHIQKIKLIFKPKKLFFPNSTVKFFNLRNFLPDFYSNTVFLYP